MLSDTKLDQIRQRAILDGTMNSQSPPLGYRKRFARSYGHLTPHMVERKLQPNPTESPTFRSQYHTFSLSHESLVNLNDINLHSIPSSATPPFSSHSLYQSSEIQNAASENHSDNGGSSNTLVSNPMNGNANNIAPTNLAPADVPLNTISSTHQLSSLVPITSIAEIPVKSAQIVVPTPIDPHTRRMKVLVAEDSVPNLKLLLSQLRRMKFDAVGVENGLLAFQKFEHWNPSSGFDPPFDLILMDGNMPVCSGYEASRKLRAMGVTVPIIAVTGNAMAEDLDEFRRAGATDVLTKPIQHQSLLKMLNHYQRLLTSSNVSIDPS
jgi:CheY-like chemotaxis protein